MNIKKAILRFALLAAHALKPLLLKIFPKSVLRKIKRGIATSSDGLDVKEPYKPGLFPKGINLVGPVRAEIGLGQSARLLCSAIQKSGIAFTIYNYKQLNSVRQEDGQWDAAITNRFPYSVNLIHLNPPELLLAVSYQIKRGFRDGKYNIAFWLWELEEFPEDWLPALDKVDEVWTPSEFASASVRKKTDLPVVTVPYGITAEYDERFGRKYFSLPDSVFLFLCMFDSNSTSGRKNPQGAIRAFLEAFPEDGAGVGLVVKISHSDPRELGEFDTLAQGRGDICILKDTMTKLEVNSLIRCADVFVSLHRAEGFGLVLAEAMLLGKPCIATNWSSNVEFMNPECACMVGYELTEITSDDNPIYKKGFRWAEPDITQAAAFMKKLAGDRDFYDKISSAAKAKISSELTVDKCAQAIARRFKNITGENVKYGVDKKGL